MEFYCRMNFLVEGVLLYLLLNGVANAGLNKHPCDFPAIFNFGDSNSDTGGWSAAFGQAGPPHGESYFHGPAGRYCDGRLVIDFIGIHTTFYSLLSLSLPIKINVNSVIG
ncbi:putative alpha-L-fucosidase [Helianthus annuus]|nr:putative alpha-L-fucosidase [Helianthus annuus]